MPSIALKTLSITAGIASLLVLTGCSQFADGVSEGYEEGISTPTSSPTATKTPEAAAPDTKEAVPVKAKGTPVSPQDLELASASFAPKKAVSGSYIVVTGYQYFDTLTAFKLDSGETVYFATSGGAPFGSLKSGMSIAADQQSRDITGFGELVPTTGPAGLDAAKMLQEHKAELTV